MDYTSQTRFEQGTPKKLKKMIQAISTHFQVDINLVWPAILGLASGLVHDKCKIKLSDPMTGGEFIEPLSLFCIGFANSSERKSAVFNWLKSPIEEIVKRKNINFEDTRLQENINRELMKDKVKKIKRALQSLEEDTPDYIKKKNEIFELTKKLQRPELHLLRLFLQDTTALAAADFMQKHPGNAAIVADGEGAFFDSLLNNHRLLELLLKGFSNESISFEQTSKPSVELPSPHISLIILTQYEKFKKIVKKESLWSEGFIPRCLFFFSQPQAGSRSLAIGPSIPSDITDWWQKRCDFFINIPYQKNDLGSNTYHILELSPEAYSHWREYSVSYNSNIHYERFPILNLWIERMKGVVPRIAAIYHLIENDDPFQSPISEQHIQQAIQTVNQTELPISRAATLYYAQNDKITRTMCKILKYLNSRHTKPESISLRDLYRNLSLPQTLAYAACDELCRLQVLTLIEAPLPQQGRPPSDSYLINYGEVASKFSSYYLFEQGINVEF